MAELLTDTQHSSFSLGDVFYALFKHKWKILIGAIIGICAAIITYSLYTPVYESNAKLLVRYVIDRSMVDPEAGNAPKLAENILSSEIEILTSWDLAMEVVDAVGIKRLMPGADASAKTEAAATVSGGLRVMGGGNIIFVSYSNPDPELATLVLSELVQRYFNKHLEVHRSAGAFDFVTQQTDQVKARLTETEEALRALKTKAGIISLTDSYAALSANLIRLDEAIHNTEEEINEQRALVTFMEETEKAAAKEKENAPATLTIPRRGATSGDILTYQALVGRLGSLHAGELELLSRYTPENQFVKIHQAQIQKLEAQRDEMEKKFPGIGASKDAGSPPTLGGEKGKLVGLEMKLEALKNRLNNLRGRVNELTEIGSQIADLERTQELQVNQYKYYRNTLEKARIDETLDPSKIPNISAVQRPTPPHRVYGKRDKTALGLAGGGLGVVVVLVLLSELIINTSVKRPLELERRLGAPLLVSIPYNAKKRKARFFLRRKSKDENANGASNGAAATGQVAPWEEDHFIRPYAVAIRDRLGLYFELNRMTHKPKLVGVTGFSEGSGTSTLAAGLASTLSEMGEGKVLLVDVNLGPQEMHPFFKGRPAMSLNNALEVNGHEKEAAAENLYLARVAQPNDGPAQLGLKRFFDIMPNLKASDFDYIIFDMPPLGQTSPTIGMAGFMDKVLLVVEAEKNGRDAVKRGYEALTSQRDNVSVIFNKARTYTPKWLNSDS